MKNFLKRYLSVLTFIPKNEFPRVDVKEILSVSDSDALRKDWEQVGEDIRAAIRKFDNQRKN